jgi:hypothetical protein
MELVSYSLQVLYFGRSVDIILILILHIVTDRQNFTQLKCIGQCGQYSVSTDTG